MLWNFTSADIIGTIKELATTTYLDLLLFTFSIFFYVVFVRFLFKNISKRDLFRLDLKRYSLQKIRFRKLKRFWHVMLYVVKYGIIFPIYVSFWFFVFSVILFVIVKNITAGEIIFVSVAFISAIRITSYFSQTLSEELAKLLPLALLVIAISDPGFFSMELFIDRILEMPSMLWETLKYLSFSIILEWILRFFFLLYIGILKLFKKERKVNQEIGKEFG